MAQLLAVEPGARVAADAQVADRPGIQEDAFHLLHQRTARPLWTYLRRVLGNDADADDLLQDTYVRYLRSPLESGGEGDVRAYLFTIASRLVVDHWRRHKRRPQVQIEAADVSTSPPPGGLALDVARALQQLKPQDRAMLWLAYVEGTGHRAIAAALGLKEKSVKVLLYRARRRLAALLGGRS